MRKVVLSIGLACATAVSSYAATFSDDFEDGDVDGWQEEDYEGRDLNGSFENSTEDKHGGARAMKVTVTAEAASGYDYAPVWDVPVSTGDVVSATAWLRWTGDGTGARIWGSWRDAAHGFVSSASGAGTYATDEWKVSTYDFGAAPGGIAFFRLEVRFYGTTLPAVGYVDDVVIEVASAGGPTDVPDIAAARAQGDGAYVRITGTVTATVDTNGLNPGRYQFAVQDSSGADGQSAIFIDDALYNLASDYSVGDQLANLTGTIEIYNGLMELQPSAPATFVGTAGPPEPLYLTSAVTDFETVESELVQIDGADIAETGTWTANFNYNLTAPTDAVIKMIRIEDNCTAVGTAIPAGPFNVRGIAYQFGSSYQIEPRFDSDIGAPSAPTPTAPVPPTPSTAVGAWEAYR